jgi:hypothetical protein
MGSGGISVAIVDGRDLATCLLFPAYLADRSTCTSLVELDETHRRLWLRLASLSRFSVALDQAATDVLIGSLDRALAGAVRCEHAEGMVVVRVRPAADLTVIPQRERRLSLPPNRGPMRISLHVNDNPAHEIDMILTRPTTIDIVAHLRRCRIAMTT